MKMTIANRQGRVSPTFEARKDKGDFKKNSMSSKSSTKESMLVTIGELIRISGKPRSRGKAVPLNERCWEEILLKGALRKEVPIPNSDLSGMLDDLLEKGIIELPPAKWPEEVGKTNDLKYCRHQSHQLPP